MKLKNSETIYQKAYKFVKRTLYQQFSMAKYLKYKNQFPKKNQSVIVSKIIADWEIAMSQHQKGDLQDLIKIGDRLIFAFRVLLSESSGPQFHVWREFIDSEDQFNLELEKKNNIILSEVHDLIQNCVGRFKASHGPQIQYIYAFNNLKRTGQIINQKNLISKAKSFSKKRFINQKSDISESQEDLFNQINRKSRVFRQQEYYEQKQQQYFTHRAFEEKKQKQFQKLEKIRQMDIQHLLPRKIQESQKFANYQRLPLQQSSSSVWSSSQWQIQIKDTTDWLDQKKKNRRINKKNKILKNFGMAGIFQTFLTHKGKYYYYCSKCYVLVRKDNKKHICVLEHEIKLSQKKMKPNDWFIPIFSIPKKMYGLCVHCKQIKIRSCEHNENFPLIFDKNRVIPSFKIGSKIPFLKVKIIKGHLSRFCFENDSVSFYKQCNLGLLPDMKSEPRKLKLFNFEVLSAFEDIPENIIFGPIGIDIIEEQMLQYLPWYIKYFANPVQINQQSFLIAPFINFNKLGFICSEKQASSKKNTSFFLGSYKNKCCMFGFTNKLIRAGQQIAFDKGFINILDIVQNQKYNELSSSCPDQMSEEVDFKIIENNQGKDDEESSEEELNE